ncbi:MAG: hypothetical protein DDT28_01252 [Dehalococcoidia bacterium]|nr:hypothetical protein [Chloroflexota bacterium]
MKPDFVHYPVHNKSRPCHIAAVLQDGNGNKQQEYRWNKGEHRAQSADNTVSQQ